METQTLAQANTWTQKQTHNHTQRSTLIMKLQRRRVENRPLLRHALGRVGGLGVMQHDSSRNYNVLEVMCPGPQA